MPSVNAGLTAGIDPLLKSAQDSNSQVRRESLRALREIAGAEQVPQLVSLLLAAKPGAERTDAEGAVIAVIRRAEDKSLINQVATAYSTTKDIEARSSLLLVLGTVGNPSTLPVLREGLKSSEDDVRRAAILGLTQWPGSEAIPDLLEAAKSDPSDSLQGTGAPGIHSAGGPAACERPLRDRENAWRSAPNRARGFREAGGSGRPA